MKTKKTWYFLLTLVITSLIFNQNWGLNMFIISILGIGYSYYFNDQKKSTIWWLSALIWFGSGLSIFLTDNVLSGYLFFFTLFNFVSINHDQKFSFPFSLIHSASSFGIGLIKFLTPPLVLYKTEKKKITIDQKKKQIFHLASK